MKTRISRQIDFTKMDAHVLSKTIDLLTDMSSIMLEDISEGDDYNYCRQIDMIDTDTGEVVAIRSEIEDCAMLLANLWTYVEEHIGNTANVECHDVGEFPCEPFDNYM